MTISMEIKRHQSAILQSLLLLALAGSIVVHGYFALIPAGFYNHDSDLVIHPPSRTTPIDADDDLLVRADSLPIRVITHNIRYGASFWNRFPHEPPWSPTRHALFTSQIQMLTRPHFTPQHSVIFLQEALHEQFRDVAEGSLGADWVGLGVGRDDGKEKGEIEGVFYRKDAWEKVHWETRWLNEDGRVGRKGWDASSVRTVTCVVLDAVVPEKKGERKRKRVLFMNAHLDDEGKVARRESAKLLLSIMEELRRKWEVDYWVVGGDFNSGKDDDAYETMVQNSTGLLDTGLASSGAEQWGDFATYTGFDGLGEKQPKEVDRIDFLFIPDSKLRSIEEQVDTELVKNDAEAMARSDIQGYAVIPNSFEGSKMGRVSDHRAVVVDLLV